MSTIVTRAGKGSALTWVEGDANFTNLNTDKYQSGDSPTFATATITTANVTTANVTTINATSLAVSGTVTAATYTASTNVFGFSSTPLSHSSILTAAAFQVGSQYNLNVGASSYALQQNCYYNASHNLVYRNDGSASMITQSGGQIALYPFASGTAGNTITPGTPPLLVDSTGYVAVNGQNISPYTGFRNRVINGNMQIDQRNAGSAFTINTAAYTYTLDRWSAFGQAADGVYTVQRSTSSPATGFANFMRITVTTADASVGAAQAYVLRHAFEGLNMSDLDFGLSTAKALKLSFWARSSATGTYAVALRNGARNRAFISSYTINSANTWEQKTVTISGDTTGTWPTDNTAWGELIFDIGSGTDYNGTADAWQATDDFRVTGNSRLIGTLNATLDITGVQLEVGSVATPFERRAYGHELALCQRYFIKWTATTAFGSGMFGVGGVNTSSSYLVTFPVEMRTAVTAISISAASDFSVIFNAGSYTPTGVAFSVGGTKNMLVNATGHTAGTLGWSAVLYVGGSGWLSTSAEL